METLEPAIRQSPPIDLRIPYDAAWLKGKHIVITGGASGFGRGFVETWAKAGASIVLGDINKAAGLEVAAATRTSSGNDKVHFVECDVRDWDAQVALFKEAVRLSPHGGIDVVVANAGIAVPEPFLRPAGLDGDSPPKPDLRTYDINLTGVLYTTHLALFWLPRNPGSKPCSLDAKPDTSGTQRDRCLLLLGSIASIYPIIGLPLYATSKHGVLGLFRTLRGCAFAEGIRVNMLNPYFIDTPLLGKDIKTIIAGGGMGRPEDVIDAGTRLTADTRILGRALVVGPKVRVKDGQRGEIVLLPKGSTEGYETALWELYADDWYETEVFSRKMVKLLNAVTVARGWGGWFYDICKTWVPGLSR